MQSLLTNFNRDLWESKRAQKQAEHVRFFTKTLLTSAEILCWQEKSAELVRQELEKTQVEVCAGCPRESKRSVLVGDMGG